MKYDKRFLEKILDSIPFENEKYIVGVAGQAGAGKTTLVYDLVEYLGKGYVLGFDYFFKLSSKERKKWIEDGERIGREEYLRRSNNLEWFDFEKYYETISSLKEGKPIKLENVYDKHSGELVKTVYIEPGIIFVDGVFILHYPLDYMLYLHRDWDERKGNIEKRDGHRKSKKDLEKRWMETQGTEIPYIESELYNSNKIADATRKTIYDVYDDVVTDVIKRSKDPEYNDEWRKYVKKKLKKIKLY